MTYVSKVENNLPYDKRSTVLLTNSLGGNADGEVVFKHLLTYYFEIGKVFKEPSGVVFWELFTGSFKDRIIPFYCTLYEVTRLRKPLPRLVSVDYLCNQFNLYVMNTRRCLHQWTRETHLIFTRTNLGVRSKPY